MRTRTTSIAKTCPACGTFNRIVILSIEIRPSFNINCSRCGAAIVRQGTAAGRPTAVKAAPFAACPEGIPVPAGRAVTPNHFVPADRRRRRDGRSAVPPARCAPAAAPAPGGVRSRTVRFAATIVAQLTVVTTAAAVMLGFALDTRPPSAVGGQLERPDFAKSMADSSRELPFSGTEADTTPQVTETDTSPQRAAADAAPRLAGTDRPRDLAALSQPQKRLLDGDAVRVKAGPRLAPVPLSTSMVYPAAGPNMLAIAPPAPNPTIAAAGEAALELSARTRREVQRRLSLTEHDPALVDGVFGPATRMALAAWQKDAGLPATGYLDARALDALIARTEDAYRAWRTAARKRGSDRARLAALDSPIPVASPMRDGCRRVGSGEILYGQSFRCDFRGLQEDLGTLRDEMAQLLRNS